MRVIILTSLLVLTSTALAIEPQAPIAPETVVVPVGKLRLKALLWKPVGPGPFPAVLFCHGSGGADSDHTAGLSMKDAAGKLAPLFLEHGYAFLYPCRRGQGFSSDQAPFMQDVLRHEETTKGKDARQHLQFVLATTDHLDDVIASLALLKTIHAIDENRIAIVGHSFGGQLTLLMAGRDNTIRAAVAFAAAAASWESSRELRECLLAAMERTTAPIMLIQAANDYSTAPSCVLADELERLHKLHVLKIYPAVGKTSDDGHNFLYLAIQEWEDDLFTFLDQHVKH